MFLSFSAEKVESLKLEWMKEMAVKKREISEGRYGLTSAYRERLARTMFELGHKAEVSGSLHVAVQQYRLATLLVPDIERVALQSVKGDSATSDIHQRADSGERSETRSPKSPDSNDREVSEDKGHNSAKRGAARLNPEYRFVNNHESGVQKGGAEKCASDGSPPPYRPPPPLLSLPEELLTKVALVVVLSGPNAPDVGSLLALARTCRRVRDVLMRPQSPVWRAVCSRLWRPLPLAPTPAAQDWLAMWRRRPHLHSHGCYAGRAAYVRRGEPSLGTGSPMTQLVQHCRIMRFWAKGTVLMVVAGGAAAAEGLRDLVARVCCVEGPQLVGLPGCSLGSYKVIEDKVEVNISRQYTDVSGQKYGSRRGGHGVLEESHSLQNLQFVLQIERSKSMPNCMLTWHSYKVEHTRNNETSEAYLNIKDDKFPKMLFCPIRMAGQSQQQPH